MPKHPSSPITRQQNDGLPPILTTLTEDGLHQIVKALYRIMPLEEADRTLCRLSQSCSTLYGLTQPRRYAQALLDAVLKGDADRAARIYQAHPQSLFDPAIGKEYAAGLSLCKTMQRRTVRLSPIRAMAAAGDIWMLEEAFNYLEAIVRKSGDATLFQAAQVALISQFPKGFDYPTTVYDFSSLVDAVDQEGAVYRRHPPANHPPEEAPPANQGGDVPHTTGHFTEFKLYFNAQTERLFSGPGSGYLFNLRHFPALLSLLHQNEWVEGQTALFRILIMGYLERLMPAVDAQVFANGLKKITRGLMHQPERLPRLPRHFTPPGGRAPLFPLDTVPGALLGNDRGDWSDLDGETDDAVSTIFENYMHEKSRRLAALATRPIPTQRAKRRMAMREPAVTTDASTAPPTRKRTTEHTESATSDIPPKTRKPR